MAAAAVAVQGCPRPHSDIAVCTRSWHSCVLATWNPDDKNRKAKSETKAKSAASDTEPSDKHGSARRGAEAGVYHAMQHHLLRVENCSACLSKLRCSHRTKVRIENEGSIFADN